MVSWRSNQTVVRRLRVKSHKLDPLAAQLRLENLLQIADLHPTWLPASAIVCLRNLRDPLPRVLKLQSRTPTQSLAWQQAICSAVEEKIRGAARPINGKLDPEANAVIFKDQAELLVGLATDWTNDRVGSRWWWRSVFKGRDITTLAFEEWLRAPQFVPTALELLSLERGIEKFARKLSSEQAKKLLLAITDCFDLSELQSAFTEGFAYLNRPLGAGEPGTPKRHRSSSNLPGVAPPATPRAPWRSLARVSLNQIPELERKCLIGVALTITRAPAMARSVVFARETLAWLRVAAAAGDFVATRNPVESNSDRDASPDERLLDGVESRLLGQWKAQPSAGAATESLVAQSDDAREANEQLPPALDPSSSEFHLSEGSAAERAITAPREPPGADRPVTHPGTANASRPSKSILDRLETFLFSGDEQLVSLPESDLLAPDECRIETKLGGLFYLINLGLFLELYSDFTTPTQKGLVLSIFDFVDLIGRRLLNGRISDDPVWELLAKLAGRTEIDSAGKGFEPPDEWRLPAQWLEAFPGEKKFEWDTDGQRLHVKHPAGFMLLDLPLRDRPAKQLHQEMRVYETSAKRATKRRPFSFSRSDSRLAQWLDWIMPYIRVRLCRALGISDTSDPGPSVCTQQASIVLTDVQLDIFFTLAEHPLELRLAGLDRDPGWVPAVGRYVRFHYR